jgi:hypothetical protein
MGVLEVQGLMQPDATDKFMTTLLRSVSVFVLMSITRLDPNHIFSASHAALLPNSIWP